MLPLVVAFYLLLTIAGGGGEVKIGEHQGALENRKEQEREGRDLKEQEREGRESKEEQEGGLERSPRELLQRFDRPTTLQRMLEEASNFGKSVSIMLIQGGF